MRTNKAGALAAAALMVGTAIAVSDDKHLHVEVCGGFVPSTNFEAGGAPTFIDDEAFAPAMPWVSWMPGFKFPDHLVSRPVQLLMMMTACGAPSRLVVGRACNPNYLSF